MRPELAAGFNGNSCLCWPADGRAVESVCGPGQHRPYRPYFGWMDVVLALWTGLGLMVAGCMVAKIQTQPQPDAMTHS